MKHKKTFFAQLSSIYFHLVSGLWPEYLLLERAPGAKTRRRELIVGNRETILMN